MYHGERLNSITHLVGTALAIAGSAVLFADEQRLHKEEPPFAAC